MEKENTFSSWSHSLDYDKTQLKEETIKKCVNFISNTFVILHIAKYAN